jgi:hypothetical protein
MLFASRCIEANSIAAEAGSYLRRETIA